MLTIAAVVVLANILFLSGWFDQNPLGPASAVGSVTRPGLLGGLYTIDPNNGVTSQTFGHQAVLDWFHLRAPWWNPYEGTGAPLAGEMVSAALFLPTIFTIFANGQLYEHMLFELLAGLFTYLLLRRLPVSQWASTAGAVVFALNGTFAWFTHAPVNVIAFLPMLVFGIEMAFSASTEQRGGGWWLIAVAGALSFYGGFPETAYIDAVLCVLWFAWRCGCLERRHLRAFVAKAAVGAIVAVLLAAPLLVAFTDYLPHSFNAHAAIGSLHLAHAALPQLLLPYVYGPIFGFAESTGTLSGIWGSVGGYLSTSLLLFGLVGLASPGRRWLRIILFAWIVLAIARIYGEPPVLGHVLGVLPGMAHIAFLRYADPALALAVVVLAALGMDAVIAQSVSRRRLLVATVVSLAVVAAATIGAVPLTHRVIASVHRIYSRGSIAWAVAIVAAGALAASLPSRRARRLLVATIVSLDAFVLFVLPEFSAPRSVTIDAAPITYLQHHQGLSRFFSLLPLQPNYGTYFRLRSLNADDALLPKVFATYMNARLDPTVLPLIFNGTSAGRAPGAPTAEQELLAHLNGYRTAGVRYVLAPAGLPLPGGPKKFTLVFRSPTTWIYRLAGVQPYFTTTTPRCTARPQDGSSAWVSCPTSTTLVRRETYMPGWSAEVDGSSRPIRSYAGAFQAVTVGPGTHRVTFSFTPPGMAFGLLGFVIGCLCLSAPSLRSRMRGRLGQRSAVGPSAGNAESDAGGPSLNGA